MKFNKYKTNIIILNFLKNKNKWKNNIFYIID